MQFTAADKSWLVMGAGTYPTLAPGTDDFLFCGWWRVEELPANYGSLWILGSTKSGEGGKCWMYARNSGKLHIEFHDGVSGGYAGVVTDGPAFTVGEWCFNAVYMDRDGYAHCYTNGNANGSTDISSQQGDMTFSRGTMNFGGSTSDDYRISHRVDSLMFFKAPDLSAVATDIIAWAYNGGSGRLCAEITDEQKAAWGAVSGWEFAEASGQRKDSWGENHLDERLGEGVTEIARAPGIVRAIAANGDGVSYWRDQSTGGKHAAQITLAKRPALVTSGINSRPVVRGDGVDDYMGVSAVSLTGAFAISAVFACEAMPSNLTLLGKDANNYVKLTDNTTVTVCFAGTSQAFTVGAMGTDPHILTVTRDADDAVNVCLDGTVSTIGAKTLAGTLAVEQVMAHGSEYFAGDIADVLVYDGEKSAAELARIHTYLARRYGITI